MQLSPPHPSLEFLAICARSGEGRARVIANGVTLGRTLTLTREAIKPRAARKETVGEIARALCYCKNVCPISRRQNR